jgi:putative chitinase
MDFTLDQFAVATGSTTENASLYYPWVVQACERFRINETPTQLAAFFASMSVETARLTAMQESLYYRDAERLARVFLRVFDEDHNRVITPEEIDKARPYCRMPKDLSIKLYGGYHGRGGMMLTWEKNYILHGKKLGQPYARDPDMVMQPEHAMLSAASFWDEIDGNSVAHDMDEVTLRVNGKARMHLAERISQRNAALQVLA